MLLPLIVGIAATALAALQLLGWLSLGERVLPRSGNADIDVPAQLLVGSGITSALAAVCAYFGSVAMAAAIVVLPVLFFLVRPGSTLAALARLGDACRKAFGQRRALKALALAVGAIYWLAAIAPPRDADVMRYHLAHIRQIVEDGRWEAIPDVHYALPFGWTLNYLPYEWLGVPQVAHLLNLGIWLVAAAAMLLWFRRFEVAPVAVLLLLALAAHPNILKAVTTAHADAYGIVVVLAATVWIAEFAQREGLNPLPLGFVGWIGAQSRYQLLAVGLAITAMFVGISLQKGQLRRDALWFGTGSACALLLSAPFYLVNLRAFGNPVWPLRVPPGDAAASYADHVARSFSLALSGSHAPGEIAVSIWRLVTEPLLFPIPLLLFALFGTAWWVRNTGALRAIAVFGLLFFGAWVLAQPSLYPRFSLYLVPVVVLGLGLVLSRWTSRYATLRTMLSLGLTGLLLVFLIADVVYSSDAVEYDVTGNKDEFHEATWYYPVYEWINHSTPSDAKFLVIVLSGHSYYLDRPYRRADPSLSGVVDWAALRTAGDLRQQLRRGGYTYLLYDDRDWSEFPGGERMDRLIAEAISTGVLRPERSFAIRRVTSRIGRQSEPSTVRLLRFAEAEVGLPPGPTNAPSAEAPP